jgi:hypothetical protein
MTFASDQAFCNGLQLSASLQSACSTAAGIPGLLLATNTGERNPIAKAVDAQQEQDLARVGAATPTWFWLAAAGVAAFALFGKGKR